VVSKRLAVAGGVTLVAVAVIGAVIWRVVLPWANPTVTVNVVNRSSEPVAIFVRIGKCGGETGRVEPLTNATLELDVCGPLAFNYEGPKSLYVSIPTAGWSCSWQTVEHGKPIVINDDGPSGCDPALKPPPSFFED
jgi:hypothetical protein